MTETPTSRTVSTRTKPVELHRSSFDVDDFEMPTGREEDWRFTPLDRLRGLLDGTPSDGHLKWSTELPAGVELTTVGAGDPLLRTVPKPVDRVAALALRNSDGAVVVRIPAEAELTEPVILRLFGTGDELVWGHVVIDVGAHARATVVIEHTGSARYAAGLSVLVGDGAQLDLVGMQLWDRSAVHLAHVGIRLGRDAAVRSTQVSLGGDLVRVVETVEYTGPGGDAQLAGLYIADAGLACHLLGIDTAAELARSPFRGAIFEGFIAAEIVKRQIHAGGRREIYGFRDEQGLEVDFLVPGRNGALQLVECKAGRTVTPQMALPLQRLAAAVRAKRPGMKVDAIIVHEAPGGGVRTSAVAHGVQAVDWPAWLGAEAGRSHLRSAAAKPK